MHSYMARHSTGGLQRAPVATLAALALFASTVHPAVAQELPPVDQSLAPVTLHTADVPSAWHLDDPIDDGELAPLCNIDLPPPTGRLLIKYTGSLASATSIAMRLHRGEAKRTLDALRHALTKRCDFSLESGLEGEEQVNGHYVALTVPKLGDQSVALQATGVPFRSQLVMMRKGDVLVVIASGGFGRSFLPAVPLARHVAARFPQLG